MKFNEFTKEWEFPSQGVSGSTANPVQTAIREVCAELADFLCEKNESYGNSAIEPLRIFSKAKASEAIAVRIDDKLSRLMRGGGYPGDDDKKDLTGYLILDMVRAKLGIE